MLIVPYGIETAQEVMNMYLPEEVLIVPYGIETTYLLFDSSLFGVLIVPYGIETPYGLQSPNE